MSVKPPKDRFGVLPQKLTGSIRLPMTWVRPHYGVVKALSTSPAEYAVYTMPPATRRQAMAIAVAGIARQFNHHLSSRHHGWRSRKVTVAWASGTRFGPCAAPPPNKPNQLSRLTVISFAATPFFVENDIIHLRRHDHGNGEPSVPKPR